MIPASLHGRYTMMETDRASLIRRLTLQEIVAVNRSSVPFTGRELEAIADDSPDLLSDVTYQMLLDEDDDAAKEA
ncbi:MAG: hypothetical protein EBY81_04100 [Verrucomicrobia bacterium]|nr:hypothetical protein [Verrucomicrobiota bacterium]NDI16918.1 hypothetical protein [Verrucomicrobiota bacterium]